MFESRRLELRPLAAIIASGLLLVAGLASPATAVRTAAVDQTVALAWGSNDEEQLGLGSFNNYVPEPISRGEIPLAATITQVEVGSNATCLLASGKVYCAGSNDSGQLGTGDLMQSLTPRAVSTTGALAGKTVTQVSVGLDFACAITDEATDNIYCWGSGDQGQLGNGGLVNESSPVSAAVGSLAGKKVTQVAAGSLSACAVTDEATNNLSCWGYSQNNELGRSESRGIYPTPTAADFSGDLSGKHVIRAIPMSGARVACALTDESTHNAYCWGSGGYGLRGDGTSDSFGKPTQLDFTGVMIGKQITDTEQGQAHTCVTSSAGDFYCWGWNDSGQLGLGNNTTNLTVSAVPAFSGTTMSQAEATFNASCALTSAGAVYCWGDGGPLLGQGFPETWNSTTPLAVTMPTGVTFASIDMELDTACALGSDAWVYCWGSGYYGQTAAGKASVVSSPSPVMASALPVPGEFSDVSVGYDTSCAISSGKAYCWGDNASSGLIGVGNYDEQYGIKAVDATGALLGKTLTQISAGNYSVCTLDNAGLAYCWGYNYNGALGEGSNTDSLTPIAVNMSGMGGATFKSLAAGANHNCGLTTAGAVWCWGGGSSGQLGNNAYDDSNLPSAVSTSTTSGEVFTQIDAGGDTTCAVAQSGNAYCWGYNWTGQMGLDAYDDHVLPILVNVGLLAGKTISQVSVSGANVCVIAAGEVYCAGDNSYGQFGNNTTDASAIWVKTDTSGVLSGKTVAQLAMGGDDMSGTYVCALDTASAAYCWGNSQYGQTTDGSLQDALVPIAVNTGGIKIKRLAGGFDSVMALPDIVTHSITSISPTSAPAKGGVTHTITGIGFTNSSKVYVDGKLVRLSRGAVTSTTIIFKSPATKKRGWVKVEVRTAGLTAAVAEGIFYYVPLPKKRR